MSVVVFEKRLRLCSSANNGHSPDVTSSNSRRYEA